MSCEELRPDYTAYALGILDDPECAEIAGHIASGCPNCRPGVASALATVGAMSGAVRISNPPASLRRRVVSMVGGKQKNSWAVLLPWGMAAGLAIALVFMTLPGRRQNPDSAKLAQALSILNDPLAKDVTFGTAKPSKGRVIVSPGRGVIFIAANLPPLEAGRTFELWVIPPGGKPIPSGTFRGEADATALYVHPGPVEPNAAAVAVTIEPEGGSPAPTTTPFIVAGLT